MLSGGDEGEDDGGETDVGPSLSVPDAGYADVRADGPPPMGAMLNGYPF